MTSWFADHDVDDIPDDPNFLPNNTYKFEVVKADVGPTTQGDKTGILFRYQIREGEWSTFFPVTDWVRVPDGNTRKDEMERMLSHLKMRLVGFGFSPEEIQKFGPDDIEKCVGRMFYGTTFSKMKDGRPNIRVQKFAVVEEGEANIDFGDNNDDEPF